MIPSSNNTQNILTQVEQLCALLGLVVLHVRLHHVTTAPPHTLAERVQLQSRVACLQVTVKVAEATVQRTTTEEGVRHTGEQRGLCLLHRCAGVLRAYSR